MISIFNTYKLYNGNTGQVLEEGDWIDNFSYYDKNHKIILQNIQIININENEITIELNDEKNNKENDVFIFLKLLHHFFHALFELTAIFCTCDNCCKVE